MTELTPITGPLALPEEQIAKLHKPTPKEFISERRGPSGMTLSYVETGYVIGRLNMIFGSVWSFGVVRESMQEDEVWVLGRLKVLLQNGMVLQKEQYGSSDIKRNKTGKPLSIGDDFKSAASDSLKKCASLLGLANDVYFPKLKAKVDRIKKDMEEKGERPPARKAQLEDIARLCQELNATVETEGITVDQATVIINQLVGKKKALSKSLDSQS